MSKLGDKLRDSKLVAWVKEKAPNVASTVLDVVGTVTGREGFNELADKIRPLIPENIQKEFEDKTHEWEVEWYKLQLEHEKEISRRWEADAGSDSWLVKHTRPLIVLSSVLIFYVLATLNALGINFEVTEEHNETLRLLLLTAVGGYFTVREIGKYNKRRFNGDGR